MSPPTRTPRERKIHNLIVDAFPSTNERELSDSYIRNHADPMWDVPKIPLIRAIPLYMLWCVENAPAEDGLVFDYTISALNKYARSKDPNNKAQDFKFHCSVEQVEAVRRFLIWCQDGLLLDYEPTLSRAIRNWDRL